MKTGFVLVGVTLAACLAIYADAAAQPPQVVNFGAGAESCGQWLATADTRVDNGDTVKHWMALSWVQGYVIGSAQQLATAVTVITNSDGEPTLAEQQARFKTVSGWLFDPPDSDAVGHFITAYCREHALEPLAKAAGELVDALVKKRNAQQP